MNRIPLALHAILWTVLTPLALADQPTVTRLSPPGVQLDTEAELLIQGARLGDATRMLLYDPGVEVLELAADGGNRVRVRLKIGPDCRPGLHAFRLATETGISNLRYFGVSPLAHVEEVEPNDDFANPQPLELNRTVNGVVENEGVDYYAIELEKGQSVTVEIEGLRLGTEFFDPFVAILDTNRFELARSDDAPLVQQDCVCSYTAEESGTYIVEVRESAFGGNDKCQYRMHLGDFPRPMAVIPAGGPPGAIIDATVIDASGEQWKESIQLPDEPGEFDFVARRDGRMAPSPNRLRVIDMPNGIEQDQGGEANDEDRDALPVTDAPVAFNGVLQSAGDVDWFRIRGKKNQSLKLKVFGRQVLRSPIDSWLEVHKATGGRLASNDDAGGPDSEQTVKFPEDGEYLISIRDQLNEGSPIHAYRIEVAPPEKSVSLTIDELQRYVSQTAEVPQGSQMAVLLRAKRSGFGGDLGLRLDGAPAGLELVTPTIAANQSYIPMLIKAADDAKPAAALAPLIAETLPDNNSQVSGRLNQRTMLVRGQNNRDMWGHDSDRLAIAVTRRLPFSIELVQPEVPLVRGGSGHYRVKAHRDEGYDERIYLRALYNPSGCRASGSIRIEPGKSEALIPVTANTKAALGKFPITVLARAKSRDASVWVASDFVTLEVADSFFEFKFGKTVAETGQSGVIAVGLEVKRPPEGDVEFEVVGLPSGVSSDQPKLTFTPGMERLAFPIQVGEDARTGQFRTIYVKASITRPGGKIVQTAGRGEIQLAKPLPANTAVAKGSGTGETNHRDAPESTGTTSPGEGITAIVRQLTPAWFARARSISSPNKSVGRIVFETNRVFHDE